MSTENIKNSVNIKATNPINTTRSEDLKLEEHKAVKKTSLEKKVDTMEQADKKVQEGNIHHVINSSTPIIDGEQETNGLTRLDETKMRLYAKVCDNIASSLDTVTDLTQDMAQAFKSGSIDSLIDKHLLDADDETKIEIRNKYKSIVLSPNPEYATTEIFLLILMIQLMQSGLKKKDAETVIASIKNSLERGASLSEMKKELGNLRCFEHRTQMLNSIFRTIDAGYTMLKTLDAGAVSQNRAQESIELRTKNIDDINAQLNLRNTQEYQDALDAKIDFEDVKNDPLSTQNDILQAKQAYEGYQRLCEQAHPEVKFTLETAAELNLKLTDAQNDLDYARSSLGYADIHKEVSDEIGGASKISSGITGATEAAAAGSARAAEGEAQAEERMDEAIAQTLNQRVSEDSRKAQEAAKYTDDILALANQMRQAAASALQRG